MHKVDLEITSPAGAKLYHKTHTAPSKWDELKKVHLLLWAACMGSSLQLDDAKSILAVLMYNIPRYLTRYLKKSGCILLSEQFDWLFKRNQLDTWLIPSIWHRCFKYYGPKSRLANLTMREYTLTEHCYEQFANTKNIEYLETLAGILFRPQRFWGIDEDIRRRLTTNGYVSRAKKFKKLPAGLKYAIYLNYEGCRNFIISRNPDVFTTSRQSGETSGKSVTSWAKIIESAAGGKFGTMAETKDSNLHEFLSEMGARIREAREMEKIYNK